MVIDTICNQFFEIDRDKDAEDEFNVNGEFIYSSLSPYLVYLFEQEQQDRKKKM